MKKILLILLLFTGFLQAQTYPVNPTKFGKISLNTNGVSTSTTKINTQESDGQINYIDAINLPVPTSVTDAILSKTDNSAGAIQGFAVTNNGNGTINVASGTAFLRATNDQYASLIKYTIPAVTNLALTDNTNNFVLVDYNGGSPALTVTTNSATINTETNSLAIAISRVGNTLDYISLVGQNNDANAKLRVRFLNQEGIRRANGAIIGFSSRNLTLTSGTLFSGLIRVNSPAFNTASPDTFTYVYNNGAVWTRATGQTQVNNTQYNNAGTLTTMPSNDFRVDYVYLLPNNPSKLYVVYGNTTYNNITLARNAPTPTALPSELQVLGLLVGRQIIQKDALTISEVTSAFTDVFSGIGVPEHNALAGLQGGSVNDYQHLNTTQLNGLIQKNTIAQIRAFSGTLTNTSFYTTDIGQEGNWYYDASDTTTADNLGTVLVTSDGKRIKRVLNRNINVKWFGAKGDSVTSDYSSIQNTINYVFSTNGGTVYFPNGTYIIDNALITSLDGINPNCQLYLPLTSQPNVANSVVINFAGETPPNYNASGLVTLPKSHDGVILSSTITGSGTNPAVIGSSYFAGSFGNWNFTQLNMNGITIRVKSKSGATYIAPTVGGINAENVATVSFEDLHVDTSGDNFNSVLPSVDVTGIIMPKIGNGAWNYLNRISVEGYNKGIRVTEHTNGTNVTVFCCVNGLYTESSDHISSFDHILIQWCNYSISTPASVTKQPTLKINNLGIEFYNNSFGTKWYAGINDINDTNNLLRGEISFVKVISSVGAVTGALVVSGANNVTKINLYSGLGSGDPAAKKKVFGSNASMSTGTGLDGTNCAIRELNSNTIVSNDEGFADMVFTHNQNGTNNAVGRIPFLNLQSTISDKRLVQLYVSTFGSKNIGKLFVMANNGTSMQTVLEIEPELFKLNKITKYASDLSASYDARTLTDKAYVDKNRLTSYTVATLPAGTVGDTAFVTDATAPTYLGTLTGGGSIRCPVFYNGTAWVSH